MRTCFLTITTRVDGVETAVSKQGELALDVNSAKLRYQDDGAAVTLFVHGQSVTIDRRGDYSFFLPLEYGKLTTGTLGIGGSEGELRLRTRKVQYVIRETSFLLRLEYDMLMDGGVQKMNLRLSARWN